MNELSSILRLLTQPYSQKSYGKRLRLSGGAKGESNYLSRLRNSLYRSVEDPYLCDELAPCTLELRGARPMLNPGLESNETSSESSEIEREPMDTDQYYSNYSDHDELISDEKRYVDDPVHLKRLKAEVNEFCEAIGLDVPIKYKHYKKELSRRFSAHEERKQGTGSFGSMSKAETEEELKKGFLTDILKRWSKTLRSTKASSAS